MGIEGCRTQADDIEAEGDGYFTVAFGRSGT